ncbi:MAG: hypothetical protein H6696_19450 [Deferribacteres bacterium]|nr:hypothetical protein [candidate division KSB1 bacterium]MCB9504104.1 hypothetical protein [Deferribacteres bacterium]
MNKKTSNSLTKIFLDTFTITEETTHWAFGPLNIWGKKVGDELWIASNTAQEGEAKTLMPPEDIAWSRWIFKQKEITIQFAPVLPDRPIVVKPEFPFNIAQGGKAKIYVHVPAWISIQQAKKSSKPMLEIPTQTLSKTWFGTTVEGEKCFWLSSPAKNKLDKKQIMPFELICPLVIINSFEGELNVAKLALRGSRLSIFSYEDQLWTDELRIMYRGTGEVSRITVSGKAPSEIAGAPMITAARDASSKGLAAKTFGSLKELSGFLVHS